SVLGDAETSLVCACATAPDPITSMNVPSSTMAPLRIIVSSCSVICGFHLSTSQTSASQLVRDGQAPNPLACRGEDRVAQRGSEGRHAGFPDTAGCLGALDDVDA